MNSKLRHTNCKLSFAKEIWFGNDVRQLEESAKERQNELSGALRRSLGLPNRPRRGSNWHKEGQVRGIGDCKSGFPSSDQAFWVDLGVQNEGLRMRKVSRNNCATSYRGKSDFVQPSYDFGRFCEARRRTNRPQRGHVRVQNPNQI